MADEERTNAGEQSPDAALTGDAPPDDAGEAPAPDGPRDEAAPVPEAAEPAVAAAAGAGTEPEAPTEPTADEAATEAATDPEPTAEPAPEPASGEAEEAAEEAAAAEPEPEPVPEQEAAADPEPASGEAPVALFPESPADGPDAAALPLPADERVDAVLLEIERLNMRVEELTRLTARHMEHIDRLHAENQQLRGGELRQALSPLLRALVRHHDNVAKLADTAEPDSSEAKALDIVRSGLLNVLSMAGVEAYDAAPQEKFDPARHQGVSRAETDDADLDGTVAQMRRCGFAADDGRVIRPAEVDVYRLR